MKQKARSVVGNAFHLKIRRAEKKCSPLTMNQILSGTSKTMESITEGNIRKGGTRRTFSIWSVQGRPLQGVAFELD